MVRLDRLKEEQLKLSRKTVLKDFGEISIIGGADCAFLEKKIIAGVVVCDMDMKIIERQHSIIDLKMPYIPGFLFYREGPAIADAFAKLDQKPDVLMIDGNGILHPLRIGIATQLGILLDQATIGISKNLLTGKIEDGKVMVGNEVRGFEIRTREYSRPIYVSPGHKISMETSIEIVRKTIRPPHKLPEPLHLAHRYANSVKKEHEKD